MMKFIFLALAATLTASTSIAAIRPHYQDMKLPTQQLVEKQTITNPAAAGTDEVLDDELGDIAGEAVTVTTFVAQPDVPRNLVITPGSTTADVKAGNVVVNGTNYLDQVISESFAFLDNASGATTGSKAFKTVTSIVFPVEDSPYQASWDVGYGEKLGLKRCMDSDTVLKSTVSGTHESTRPTIAYDADEVEKNTADFNGTMNGSADFDVYFFQNFNAACQP